MQIEVECEFIHHACRKIGMARRNHDNASVENGPGEHSARPLCVLLVDWRDHAGRKFKIRGPVCRFL